MLPHSGARIVQGIYWQESRAGLPAELSRVRIQGLVQVRDLVLAWVPAFRGRVSGSVDWFQIRGVVSSR